VKPRRLQPFPLGWLTAVWVLLWGDLSPGNVLAGLALAAAILVALPLPRIVVGIRVRPWPFVVLVTRFLADVVVASCQVAWLTVRPRPVPPSSVVTVQLRTRDELFATLVGEMMSLVPGSLIVDLDGRTGHLSMHVLDVATPDQAEAFRRSVLEQEERLLRALAARPDGSRTAATTEGEDS
jgi:multicomponent Na+:H+ antiporter subunit E